VSALLEIAGLEVAYGQSQVLFGIDLTMAEGEAATLLGRNGMGKTTTLRALCGLQPVKAGRIRFMGEEIVGWRPDRIGRAGIALVPEGRQCFPNLTVDEHLVAFFANRRGVAAPWSPARVYDLFPRLRERRRNLGNQLSGGEQQMLAIGRALVTNPRLLVLDEATEGLAPLIREEIWACLARLRGEGQSVLVVDKYVDKLIALADHHTLIERGQVVWSGTSAALAADHGIWHRYLGI
jgi:branched-chain amino acid transport system ATP-binding protein